MHNRHTAAGWAREVTVRNFPMSKAMAGVNMRLPKGAVRELHWHLPAEWAYVTYGTGRITAVDTQARKFVADVKEGDLWFFPSGIPHSIQGLGPDGCEFILVFNDGNFSEDSTFLISDWVAHTPTDVLQKNFDLPAQAFADIPHKDLWIFDAPVPGSLESDLAQSHQEKVVDSYKFSLADVAPIKTRGGSVRIADKNNFKASDVMSAALVEVAPGGLRELHWHPTSDEWQYYISGKARMTVFASEGRANTVDFAANDVGYVPRSYGHYIENVGTEAAALPRGVLRRPVRRRLARLVDGQHAARARRRASQHGRRRAEEALAAQDASHAGLAIRRMTDARHSGKPFKRFEIRFSVAKYLVRNG